MLTKASISELEKTNSNINKAYAGIKSNDIPKIYICAGNGFRNKDDFTEYTEWINDRQKELGMEIISEEPNDEVINNNIEAMKQWHNERIKPYTDLLGNTEIVLLPGDHMIFQQKPDELAEIIKSFIEDLDKNRTAQQLPVEK